MSENTKPNSQNDEVDLGQLFKMIGRAFQKIGDLFSKLFSFLMFVVGKLIVFLLLFVNIFIKHIVIIGLIGVVGFVIPYLLDKKSKKTYTASMLVSQNYSTGKVLYANIERYNDLAADGDSISLSRELNVDIEKAKNFTEFTIKGLRNRNQILEEYTLYIKEMDSIDKPTFKEYFENVDLSSSALQSITVNSIAPEVYENLSKTIINAINKNNYFVKEKEETILNLKNNIKLTKESIVKTDSLQKKYFEILNKYYTGVQDPSNTKQGSLNLNLTNNKEKINTKEFELFQIQEQNRQKLNDLQAQLEKKQEIVELQKDFESPTLVESKYKDLKINLPFILMLIATLFFVFKKLNLNSYIKEYGSKEKLLK
ncbi:hypothetical protein ACFQ1Q_04940 [Winogradskyella litorisediminis]|uniref:Polysaccharide chain length determinant N-terminal domain-containing protein n=1 Tax=Winogradskyella litorisediminis TaxID=1156618 RepID=A0ABW3N4R0_9FLAO